MTLPNNAVPLYRKLAYKSKLGFGKFADYTIQDIFTINCEDYLVWAYYSLSNISFLDEILDRLGIQKIDKPGTNLELLETYNKQSAHDKFDNMTRDQYMHFRMKQKSKIRGRKLGKCLETERSIYRSKGELQRINHGHKK